MVGHGQFLTQMLVHAFCCFPARLCLMRAESLCSFQSICSQARTTFLVSLLGVGRFSFLPAHVQQPTCFLKNPSCFSFLSLFNNQNVILDNPSNLAYSRFRLLSVLNRGCQRRSLSNAARSKLQNSVSQEELGNTSLTQAVQAPT